METTQIKERTTKSPFCHPLTLVVAIFFFITALTPVALLFMKAEVNPGVETTTTTGLSYTEPIEYMTIEEKIDSVAAAIEKACYSNDTESSQEFALSCTKIFLVVTPLSSLLFAIGLGLMYSAPKLTDNAKSIFAIVCASAVAIGAFMLLVLYAVSTVNIITRLTEIPNDPTLLDVKLKDAAKTEHLYFLLRNLAIIAGLGLFVFRITTFAFNRSLAKSSKLKVLKGAKKLSSAYTAVSLIGCFYVTTICLTWTFNYTTKALLIIAILLTALSFMMIALLSRFRQHLKNCIIAEQNASVNAKQ